MTWISISIQLAVKLAICQLHDHIGIVMGGGIGSKCAVDMVKIFNKLPKIREWLRNSDFQEDRNGSVVLASSRHMKEEYEMNMTIPRAKVHFQETNYYETQIKSLLKYDSSELFPWQVSMTGEGMTAYENNGYK